MAAAANAFALGAKPVERRSSRDVGFAIGIIAILTVFFLPIPSFLIDLGWPSRSLCRC